MKQVAVEMTEMAQGIDGLGAGVSDNLPNMAAISSMSASTPFFPSSGISVIKLISSFLSLKTH